MSDMVLSGRQPYRRRFRRRGETARHRHRAIHDGSGDPPPPELRLRIAAQSRATAARTTPTVLKRTPPEVDPDAPPMNINPSQKKRVRGLTSYQSIDVKPARPAEALWNIDARVSNPSCTRPGRRPIRPPEKRPSLRHEEPCNYEDHFRIERDRPPGTLFGDIGDTM